MLISFKAHLKQTFLNDWSQQNNKTTLNCRENDGRLTTLGAEMESRRISAQWRAKPEPVSGVITALELFSLGKRRAVTNCLIYRGQRSNTGTTAAHTLFPPFYFMINLQSHTLSLSLTRSISDWHGKLTQCLLHPAGGVWLWPGRKVPHETVSFFGLLVLNVVPGCM